MSGRRNWVVSVSSENEDPLIWGPYTERTARRLTDAFNEQIERGAFEGEGWLHAGAYPLQNPQTTTAMLAVFGKTPRTLADTLRS